MSCQMRGATEFHIHLSITMYGPLQYERPSSSCCSSLVSTSGTTPIGPLRSSPESRRTCVSNNCGNKYCWTAARQICLRFKNTGIKISFSLDSLLIFTKNSYKIYTGKVFLPQKNNKMLLPARVLQYHCGSSWCSFMPLNWDTGESEKGNKK